MRVDELTSMISLAIRWVSDVRLRNCQVARSEDSFTILLETGQQFRICVREIQPETEQPAAAVVTPGEQGQGE